MYLTVAHGQDAIRPRANLSRVRHDDKRLIARTIQFGHQRHHIVRGLAIEIARWLVRPDNRWIVDERARNGDALALSA